MEPNGWAGTKTGMAARNSLRRRSSTSKYIRLYPLYRNPNLASVVGACRAGGYVIRCHSPDIRIQLFDLGSTGNLCFKVRSAGPCPARDLPFLVKSRTGAAGLQPLDCLGRLAQASWQAGHITLLVQSTQVLQHIKVIDHG